MVDGVTVDQIGDAARGIDWLREHGRPGSEPEWRSVRTARDTLQEVIREDASHASLESLLKSVAYRPELDDLDGVTWRLDVPSGRTAAVAAVLAWAQLRRSSPGRLRPCANDECRLFLIDRSKPNKARWCSMSVCGNRLKARRHYDRVRSISPHPE
jgi:predicted RNA-binding Zn ribbon-like protein